MSQVSSEVGLKALSMGLRLKFKNRQRTFSSSYLKSFPSFDAAKWAKYLKLSLQSPNFLCSCISEKLFSGIQITFVPNAKEEDKFSGGINMCHTAISTIINKWMLSPLDAAKSYCALYCKKEQISTTEGNLAVRECVLMLLTGVRARTGLWRLPLVSEICHYHGATWGKREAKSKIEKGCCRFFWGLPSSLCFSGGTHSRRRDLRPSNALTGMQRRRL